jgi:hypothetical protein
VLRQQPLEQFDGAPFPADQALGALDAQPRPHVGRHRLTHRDAIIEGRERLAEGVIEGRHQPHLVDVQGRAQVERGHEVTNVRRVEAAPEERDLAGHHFTEIFVLPPPN